MFRCARVRTVVLAFGGLAFAGACAVPDETPPASEFPAEQRFARLLAGRVYSDAAPVSGALVRLEPSPLWAEANGPRPASYSTNASGFYQFEGPPQFVDLTIRAGQSLSAFRNLSFRYFDPQIQGEQPWAAFLSRIVPLIEPPPGPDSEVAYFASGDDAVSLEVVEGQGLSLGIRSFESKVTLHVVVYPKEGGLTKASAYGRADGLLVASGSTLSATINVAPIDKAATPEIVVAAPAGFALDDIDVGVDFGTRTISQMATKVKSGEAFSVALIPFSRWFAEAHASSARGVTDSGRFIFDATQPTTTVTLVDLPAPVSVDPVSQGTDAGSEAGAPVVTRVTGDGEGVRVHAFVPEDKALPTVRVVTTDRSANLPNPSEFGFGAATGIYTWTMRHYPKAPSLKSVQGPDGFVYQPSAAATPRNVTLY